MAKWRRNSTILNRGYWPAQIAAGVTAGDSPQAKYSGLHTLRHFFASWCINRRTDGGLDMPIKLVQERLGHSTIVLTSDTYGHLFPRGDDEAELDAAELDAAERALLSPVNATRDITATCGRKILLDQRREGDLKSLGGNPVRVRVPPSDQRRSGLYAI